MDHGGHGHWPHHIDELIMCSFLSYKNKVVSFPIRSSIYDIIEKPENPIEWLSKPQQRLNWPRKTEKNRRQRTRERGIVRQHDTMQRRIAMSDNLLFQLVAEKFYYLSFETATILRPLSRVHFQFNFGCENWRSPRKQNKNTTVTCNLYRTQSMDMRKCTRKIFCCDFSAAKRRNQKIFRYNAIAIDWKNRNNNWR